MADNILLTPKQAAEYLNVTVAKVRKDIFEREGRDHQGGATGPDPEGVSRSAHPAKHAASP